MIYVISFLYARFDIVLIIATVYVGRREAVDIAESNADCLKCGRNWSYELLVSSLATGGARPRIRREAIHSGVRGRMERSGLERSSTVDCSGR